MPKTRLISPGSIPNHKLLKNLQLQDNYLSNDGGDEGIRIDDDGNVGIGQASPTAVLEVENAYGSNEIAFKVDNNEIDEFAIAVEAVNIHANVMDISADSVQSAKVINISAEDLTTGSAIYIDSDSDSTSTRNIVEIIH